MKSAAGRTGGHFTQINPDEKVSWRAFELLSTLNAPRLIDLKVDSGRKNVRFLTFADTIAHGQEIAAIARLPLKLKRLSRSPSRVGLTANRSAENCRLPTLFRRQTICHARGLGWKSTASSPAALRQTKTPSSRSARRCM